jgi:hypothetical protein
MLYFLHAVFHTGKRRRDSRKFQFSVGFRVPTAACGKGILAS